MKDDVVAYSRCVSYFATTIVDILTLEGTERLQREFCFFKERTQ